MWIENLFKLPACCDLLACSCRCLDNEISSGNLKIEKIRILTCWLALAQIRMVKYLVKSSRLEKQSQIPMTADDI